MEDGLLSLKWNNHKSTFFHILSNLRKRETYTDATLACEGKFFPVHKLVLSSCSDYFSEVFERTNCKSPVVILKDISHSDIEALLDYMYLGEVDVKQSELAALIKAAECLRIKGLAVPDEDPSGMQKKNKASAECRSSPSAKRIRRSSGGNDSSHSKYKSVSSINSSRSQTSTSVISTLVPSQLGNTDSLSRGPVDPIPDSSFIGSSNSQSDLSSSISDRVRSEQSSGPVQIVKLEVEDGISNSDYPNSSLERAAVGNKRDSGITSGNELQGTSTVHNDFDTYSSSSIVIEKEEHEQIESYNGSDQIPGPSGVQATSQILNWNEEDGSFPHNIFGQEESSQQQVCIAIVEPEMLAVRMFQGVKSEVSNVSSSAQVRLDNSSRIIALEPPRTVTTQMVEQGKKQEAHIVVYGNVGEHGNLKNKSLINPVSIQSVPFTSFVSVSTASPSYSSSEILNNAIETQAVTIYSHEEKTISETLKSVKGKKSAKQKTPAKRKKTSSVKKSNVAQVEYSTPLLEHHLKSKQPKSQRRVQTHFQQPNPEISPNPHLQDQKSVILYREMNPVHEDVNFPKLHSLQNAKFEEYEPELQDNQNLAINSAQIGQQQEILHSNFEEMQVESVLKLETNKNSAVAESVLPGPHDLSSRRIHYCPFCEYRTRSKVDISKHIRVHTREKPYKCPHCSYETGDKSNLNRHSALKHRQRDLDAPVENEALLPQHPNMELPNPPLMVPNTEVGNVESCPDPLALHAIEVVSIPYSETIVTTSNQY